MGGVSIWQVDVFLGIATPFLIFVAVVALLMIEHRLSRIQRLLERRPVQTQEQKRVDPTFNDLPRISPKDDSA